MTGKTFLWKNKDMNGVYAEVHGEYIILTVEDSHRPGFSLNKVRLNKPAWKKLIKFIEQDKDWLLS